MNDKELAIAVFRQREEERYHHGYDEELLQYEYLRDGDMRSVEESKRIFRTGITGKLSDDPVRDKKYLFVASTTLATRFAIEGGMEAQEAYNLSDLYIQKMDLLKTVDSIFEHQTEMITDFTTRMSHIHSVRNSSDHETVDVNISEPVLKVMDYIYYHLHMPMTVASIGDAIGYSPNYLNSLFKKEKGLTISEYIRMQRVEASKRLLLYSGYSISEISSLLAFSSESHFIKVFREQTDLTPKQYKAVNYRHHSRWGNRSKT